MSAVRLLCAVLLLVAGVAIARAQAPAQSVTHAATSDRRNPRSALISILAPLALGGALEAPGVWQAYKTRFVTEQGRVIDTGNNFISHSEGQGYAMLLAVAANDRAVFDRLWSWTRANLMVRDDSSDRLALGADATTRRQRHEQCVATATFSSPGRWRRRANSGAMCRYRIAARRIATELARKLVLFKTKLGAILLPASRGFHAEDRPDGPVVNLSYYVFPAFARLDLVAPEVDWAGLTQTGLDLLDATRTAPQTLPADWIALEDWKVRPAEGFPPLFSYNAVRIPLYLAWAGLGEREQYAPFIAWAARGRGAPAIVDVASGRDVGSFGEAGIGAIAALVACVVEGTKLPADFAASHANENYYPATLHMLALVAAQMRYASCLRK